MILPRGVFYDSKLYGGLNGSFNQNSPFAGATAYGNSNTFSSNLNSRVIQMVIAKNLTLAQAWGILNLARTNTSGNVTVFPFFATSELYTLGLSWEASKLASNTSVVNGGNWSMPAPPPSLWQLFWNAIAGWAERVWNAVVAVGAFFYNLGKWLVQAALAYLKGLTTGNWTDFQDKVLKPLVDALQALIKWVIDFVKASIDTGLKPALDPLLGVMRQSLVGLVSNMHFSRLTITSQFWAILGAIVVAVTLVTVALLAIEIVTIAFTGSVPGLVPTIIGLLRPVILTIFIAHAVTGVFGVLTNAEEGRPAEQNAVADFFGAWLSGLEAAYGIIGAVWGGVGEWLSGGVSSPATGLALALTSLVVALWAGQLASGFGLLAADVFGVAVAIFGIVVTYQSGGFSWSSISWVLKLESVLTIVSAIAAFVLIGKRAVENAYGVGR